MLNFYFKGKLETSEFNHDVIKMIWKVGNDKANELLIHYGYSVDQLVISDDIEVSVLNPFGTSILLEDEQIEDDVLTQNIVLDADNETSLLIESSGTLDDELHINLYDKEDCVKTIELDGRVVYKSNAISNMIRCNEN